MAGLPIFLKKEFTEIVRTWRLWVMPLVMISFAIMSPVIALLTPQLVDSIASGQGGLTIEIPDPTAIDAFLQFSKNNTQIALFAIIISMAGMVSAERRSGTAILVLTKPLSRGSFVTAKVISNWVLVTVATVLAWGVCTGLTAALFEIEFVAEFARGTAAWLVLALMLVAVMALLSVAIRSQAGAAGAGIGVYLLLAIFSAWGPARDNTFVGLFNASDRLVMGEEVELLLPILTAVVVTVAVVALAIVVFRRQEL